MTESFFQAFALFGTGAVLGFSHAFDADHIAAVSAMVSEVKNFKKSSLLGVFWGAGHTTSLFFVGFLLLVFKLSISERTALFFEFAVGSMLVALGIRAVSAVIIERMHIHAHTHGGRSHVHLHSHRESRAHRHGHRSFAVGLLHGLAGSAALALLALSGAGSVAEGLFFILAFGAGSVLGMLGVSGILGASLALAARVRGSEFLLRASAGLASIYVGATMLSVIGGKLLL